MWTLSIGNGEHLNDSVQIPPEMVTKIIPNTKENSKSEENCMKKFCHKVFPDLERNLKTSGNKKGLS